MSDFTKPAVRTQISKSGPKGMQALHEIAEAIKLHAEIFGLSEHETKHLRKAYFYSEIEGGLVPDSFKGDYRAIFIMSQLAEKMNCDLIEVLQGGYFVHGRFGWYTQFQIQRVLALGIFTAIDYEQAGSIEAGTYQVRAVGTRPDGTKAYGTSVSLTMAKAENWTKNVKYKTMPVLMLKKRAAGFLIRETAPHVFGGRMITAEELEDIASSKNVMNAESSDNLESIKSMLSESSAEEPELPVDAELVPESAQG